MITGIIEREIELYGKIEKESGASGGGKGYYLVSRKRKIIQMTTEGE